MEMYVYCSYGDELVSSKKQPVDSPAAVEAMIEWMSRTYNVKRMYWRGAGEELWDRTMQFGKETPFGYEYAAVWKRHTLQSGTTRALVSAGKRYGMEIFMYTGLFDYGVQPDIGIIGPYMFEDRGRIEHPEWCMRDRWGERRCPGPFEFAFPEARQYVIRRYVEEVVRNDYHGINFYTYVENCGLRYLEEFGFAEPIVSLFQEKYPEIDLRKGRLSDEQTEHWYACRGKFVTDFVRELHAELKLHGKKLSIILDAENPDYVQPWWGKSVPGTGYIRTDWQTWIAEGIVDELWVQLAEIGKQTSTLDNLLRSCAGTSVKLVVRTPKPFDSVWEPYVSAGVTPVAVITSPVNGIERMVKAPPSTALLHSEDWIHRSQGLTDMAEGRIEGDVQAAIVLAQDRNLLVRQRAMRALKKFGTSAHLPIIYAGLHDEENCVRVAAAEAAGVIHDGDTPGRLLAAIESDDTFLMKSACAGSLLAIGENSLSDAIAGLSSKYRGVREVCAKALIGLYEIDGTALYPLLTGIVRNADEDEIIRYWTIDGLLGLCLGGRLGAEEEKAFIAELAARIDKECSTVVQLHIVRAIGKLAEEGKTAYMPTNIVGKLEQLFREYGDGCLRTDAAFGWRLGGNALLSFGAAGIEILEKFREQTQNRWLAWIAYEVVYLSHQKAEFLLIDQRQMIADHEHYAPQFPGYRAWREDIRSISRLPDSSFDAS
jgi:HEAT repeat protein